MDCYALELVSDGLDESPNPADRRAHPRIPRTELTAPVGIRIPHRPAVSLVDLSAGGALLELPFQMRPTSSVTLQLRTQAEQFEIPFHLLRCQVAGLRDGVRYHAAGAFDQLLKLPAMPNSYAAAPYRLIAALEGLLRASRAAELTWRDARFDELVLTALAGLRRCESTHLISVKLKAFLTQRFPSLSIHHAPRLRVQDTMTTARFFGLDFKSSRILTAGDRRLLRSCAQVLAMIEGEEPRHSPDTEPYNGTARRNGGPAADVVRSPAEWLVHNGSSTRAFPRNGNGNGNHSDNGNGSGRITLQLAQWG